MSDKKLYKIWTPNNALWIDWVRPLSFLNASKANKTQYELSKIHYIDELDNDVAIFVDLIGDESIVEGIALANLGYRPIPLFNGTDAQDNAFALVDTKSIKEALLWASNKLKDIHIKNDAPPAFLLDKTRIHRYKYNKNVYDNSWDLYAQDIPTPERFLKYGINKIIVYTDEMLRDLKRIFYDFQKKGIKIYITDGFEKPKLTTLEKPPKKDKFH